MNRLFFVVSVASAAVVAGCPIYPDNQSYQVCNAQACFDCPDNTYSSACVPWPCQGPGDCSSGDVQGSDASGTASDGDGLDMADATVGSASADNPMDGEICLDGACE